MESSPLSIEQEGVSSPLPLAQPGLDVVTTSRSAEESRVALGILAQNITGAASTVHYEGLQFALLLGNDRNDDEAQLLGAAGEGQTARSFLNLFQESYAAFKQTQDYQMLLGGQATPWRPVLRDSSGKLIGGFPTVLLNPTLVGPAQQPVVQIVLPQHDWLSQIPPRHQAEARAHTTRQPLRFLDRLHGRSEQAQLARRLDNDPERAAQLSQALLSRTETYAPLLPGDFTRKARQLEPALNGRPTGWLAELFPLYRVYVVPKLALLSSQRIDEAAFAQELDAYTPRLSPAQQLALLRGDQLGNGQQTLTYNPLANKLQETARPLLVRGYSPDTEQVLTGMLTLEQTKLGQSQTPGAKEAFVTEYKKLHRKGENYDPTDPVAYYGQLDVLFRQNLATSTDTPKTSQAVGRLLAASQQYSQLFQVQTTDTVKQTLASATAPLPSTALRELLSTNLMPINEQALFAQHQGLRTYKGVPLQPIERKALLRGEQIELSGLQDDRRGSLYRASITLDATKGQPQERRAGNEEQVRTNKPAEAAAHKHLTGGQGNDSSRPTPQEANALRTAPEPPTVTPAQRPRH